MIHSKTFGLPVSENKISLVFRVSTIKFIISVSVTDSSKDNRNDIGTENRVQNGGRTLTPRTITPGHYPPGQ